MKSTKRSSLQHPDPVKRLAADGVVVPALEPDAVSDGTAGDVADADFTCASAEMREGVSAGTAAAASMIADQAVHPVKAPKSPLKTRERFLAGLLPARSCCNLDLIRAPAGTKFNLTAICIAVFSTDTS